MRRFARILCPVDFSADSRVALRFAATVADRHRGAVTVLFVNDPLLNAAAAAAAYDVKQLAKHTETALKAFIKRTLGERGAAVALRTGFGVPAEEIQRTARTGRHDLIVLGTHGRTNAPKMFFGSTTERVLRTTKIPVLVVSRSARRVADRARPLADWPGRRALIPIDLDDFSARDVRDAAAVARSFGAEPWLLHSVRPSRVPEWLRIDPARHDAKRVAVARRRLSALGRTLDAGVQVVFGEPAEQIALCATADGHDLIVLTVVKPQRLFGPRQGSITYKVVASGAAPVLALPSARHR